MKRLLQIILIYSILFLGCDKQNERIYNSPPIEIQKIIDKGVTVDSVALDYAKLNISEDGFLIIESSSSEQFAEMNEALIYFQFISHSRDSLVRYYANENEKNIQDGFIVDYLLKYHDNLESVLVEIKKNNSELYEISNTSEIVEIIPTPEINSGLTFVKYEITIDEFIGDNKYSFPDSFIMSFKDQDMETNLYTLKITFKFNSGKEYTLNTHEFDL